MDGDGSTRGSFEPVSLSHRRPPIERWAVVVAVLLVIVVAKPWQQPGDVGVTGGPTSQPRSTPPPPTALPSAGSGASAATAGVAAFCLSTRSWLVASVERTIGRAGDQRIRVWRVIEPASAAAGPDDPVIPVVSVVSEGLTELGWCAPVGGGEAPALPVSVTVWLHSPGGAQPLSLDASRPTGGPTAYGAMYRPPGKVSGATSTEWPDGTYVFRYREGDGRQRWFAIDVETRPHPSPTLRPSPTH